MEPELHCNSQLTDVSRNDNTRDFTANPSSPSFSLPPLSPPPSSLLLSPSPSSLPLPPSPSSLLPLPSSLPSSFLTPPSLLPGPPRSQQVTLKIPKKTSVFVDQTVRERGNATGEWQWAGLGILSLVHSPSTLARTLLIFTCTKFFFPSSSLLFPFSPLHHPPLSSPPLPSSFPLLPSIAMHNTFQRDLYRLRLETARAYVKAVTTSLTPITSSQECSLKIAAQVGTTSMMS